MSIAYLNYNFLSRHYGSKGLLVGGTNHEEVTAPEVDPAVRRLHDGGAHLYHHRAHEEWKLAGISTGNFWRAV